MVYVSDMYQCTQTRPGVSSVKEPNSMLHSWCTRMTAVIPDAQPVFSRLITLDFVLLLNKHGSH